MNNLIRIFYSPGSALAADDGRSSWRLPFVAALVGAILIAALEVHVVGLDNSVRRQLKSMPNVADAIGAAKIDEMAAASRSTPSAVVSYASAPVVVAAEILAAAAVLKGLAFLWGVRFSFRTVLGITSYAILVHITCNLVGALLGIALHDSGSNPLTELNAGLLIRDDFPRWIILASSSVHPIALWCVGVVAIGLYKHAAGALSKLASVSLPALPWFAFVVAKAKFMSLL